MSGPTFWLRDWQISPWIFRRGIVRAQWQGWCLLSVQVGGTALGLLYVRHRDGKRGLRGLRLRAGRGARG